MLTCHDVMHPVPTPLYADAPLGDALDFILQRHMFSVPVVDRQGRFVGLLSGERLLRFLLPRELTMIRGLDRMGYLRESADELRERLAELGQQPISAVMQPRAKVVHPEMALIEAHSLLAEGQPVVPVVERDSQRLLGAISFFTIMAALRHEATGSDRLLTAANNGNDG